MPSSLELAQRPSSGVVPRKVGTLWGEYGNLKLMGNAFSGTDYWTSTQLMGFTRNLILKLVYQSLEQESPLVCA